MSGGDVQEGVNRISNSFPTVPTIQFTDASPAVPDDVSASPKRLRPFSRKQFYCQNGETMHVSGTPSPLSTSPESGGMMRPNHCRFYDPSNNNHPKIVWSGSKNLNAGFVPIKYGSAGDSQDELSGDSDNESSSTSNELAAFNHLRLFPNPTLGRATQFRRHSWIWYVLISIFVSFWLKARFQNNYFLWLV